MKSNIFRLFLAVTVCWVQGSAQSVSLTDANFSTAVELWFSNEASAIETYGHIRDWDTSAVTNMGGAFEGRLPSTRISVVGMSAMSPT